MSRLKPLIAGNWKMNGLQSALAEIEALRAGLHASGTADAVDVIVCPPATLIPAAVERLAGSPILIGGQDCRAETSGAFTGDLSAAMLADGGARAVILGHSERRSLHGERDHDIKAKASAAHAAGLLTILCIGETAGERRLGLTFDVLRRQLARSAPEGITDKNSVIAYEPVWAIGTGLTPQRSDIEDTHLFIRRQLAENAGEGVADRTRILYGGSVKPENAQDILTIEGVDGALVGGASLVARDFLAIIAAHLKRKS